MKNTEIRELSDKELVERIKEERLGFTKLNLTNAISPVDNPNKIKESKRLIARLLTEKKSRELANVK